MNDRVVPYPTAPISQSAGAGIAQPSSTDALPVCQGNWGPSAPPLQDVPLSTPINPAAGQTGAMTLDDLLSSGWKQEQPACYAKEPAAGKVMTQEQADAIMKEYQTWLPGQREIAADNRAKGLPDWYRTDAQLLSIIEYIDTLDQLRAANGLRIYGDTSKGVENAYLAEGLSFDSKQLSFMAHAKGDLKFILEINKRHGDAALEAKRKADWESSHGYIDKLVTSYEKEQAYARKKEQHPDWEVKPNILLDMTDMFVKSTPEVSGKLWLLFAGGMGTAKPGVPRNGVPTSAANAAQAEQILKKLGVAEGDLAAFAKGEKVWVIRKEAGIETSTYFQLSNGKLTAGVLEIKNTNPTASLSTVRTLKSFLDQTEQLAQKLNAKTLRLEGNMVTNLGPKGVEGLLNRLGFKLDPKDPGLHVRETLVK